MKNTPLNFVKMMVYSGKVYVEFRIFPEANANLDIFYSLLWADRVFKNYGIPKPRYGKDWRVWKEKPTSEEHTAAPWEE